MVEGDSSNRGYEGLEYDKRELSMVMRRTYDEIIDFVTTAEFQALMAEMGRLPSVERPYFVASILMDNAQLASRGIVAPPGILIQRSSFGDRRPTLFVVKKFLPERYLNVWQNVNITFDDEYPAGGISRDATTSWRAPIAPDVQALAMSEARNLETL